MTGKGTPVTEETFAAWKAQRKSKKEVEEEGRLAKEASGRALFEKGDWMNDSESEDEEQGDDGDAFDLAALRAETRKLQGEDDEEEAKLKHYGTT